MEFQDLVDNGEAWVGGRIETFEGTEDVAYSAKVTKIHIKGNDFVVENDGTTSIEVSVKYSRLILLNGGAAIRFLIPYIGEAFLYKSKA